MMPRRLRTRLPVALLDRDTADRLLSGRIHPDDAPPGYAGVAHVVRVLIAPARTDELVGQRSEVAAAVRTLADNGLASRGSNRTRRSWARRSAALAVATALVTTGVAAAAVMPEHAKQLVGQAVSGVISIVGIAEPEQTGARDASDPPASHGIWRIATDQTMSGLDKGRRVSERASDGAGHAGEHGPSDDHGADDGHGYPPGATTPDLPDEAANAGRPSRRANGGSHPVGPERAGEVSAGRASEVTEGARPNA